MKPIKILSILAVALMTSCGGTKNPTPEEIEAARAAERDSIMYDYRCVHHPNAIDTLAASLTNLAEPSQNAVKRALRDYASDYIDSELPWLESHPLIMSATHNTDGSANFVFFDYPYETKSKDYGLSVCVAYVPDSVMRKIYEGEKYIIKGVLTDISNDNRLDPPSRIWALTIDGSTATFTHIE